MTTDKPEAVGFGFVSEAAFWIHQPPASWVRDALIPDDFVLSEAKKILPY